MTKKLIELLSKSDEDLFRKGACHIYAAVLKDRFAKVTLKLSGHEDSYDDLSKGMHVYAVIGDYKIDVFGPQNEAQYLNSLSYAAWSVSVNELMKVDLDRDTDNGPLNHWRHYLEPEFLSLTSARARLHIENHLSEWRPLLLPDVLP